MSIAIHLYAFYLGFALAISIYRLWQQSRLNLWNKLAFAPVLIGFFTLDVFLNYTLFLVFGVPVIEDFKDLSQYTISWRLAKARAGNSGFLKALADFVCVELLDPIDPNGNHC